MSVYVSSWVWKHSKASGNELLVLLTIADQADDDGRGCFAGIKNIATRCRMSERSVQRALQSLAEMGELEIHERRRANGSRTSNGYVVVMAEERADEKRAPEEPAKEPAGERVVEEERFESIPEGGCQLVTTPVTPVSPGWCQSDTRVVTAVSPPYTSLKPLTTSDVADAPSSNRPEVDRLCVLLADLVEANGSKRPTITKRWQDSARLLLDADGKTEDQVARAIRWCQADEFWRANVLSMPKLRAKYDQMRLAAQREGRGFAKTWREDVPEALR